MRIQESVLAEIVDPAVSAVGLRPIAISLDDIIYIYGVNSFLRVTHMLAQLARLSADFTKVPLPRDEPFFPLPDTPEGQVAQGQREGSLQERIDATIILFCSWWRDNGLNELADDDNLVAIVGHVEGADGNASAALAYLERAKESLTSKSHFKAKTRGLEVKRLHKSSNIDSVRSTAVTYRVWFATDRQRVIKNPSPTYYSNERSRHVNYGYCDVLVPESHCIGSLGSPWWRRLVKRSDDRLRLWSVESLPNSAAFWAGVEDQTKRQASRTNDALVFIHGYNVSFREAALRAAQIGFDLSIQGAMAFFSWPSRGAALSYAADEATIEASEEKICDFLCDFVARSGASRVHILAHSMGNRGLLRALNRITSESRSESKKPFFQIIMAAADIDRDLFLSLSRSPATLGLQSTLYVSQRDLAVKSSAFLHGNDRAGFTPPITIATAIDTIDVGRCDATKLGHGYVAECRSMLTDIHQMIKSGLRPDERFGLTGLRADGAQYWRLND